MVISMNETRSQGAQDSAPSVQQGSGWKECWRQDRLDGIGWAALFIWAAILVVADSAGIASEFGWWDGWGVFFTGAGVIVLAGTVLRLLIPEYRASWAWSLLVGSVLLAIGLGTWEGLEWIWAVVLAAIGVAILRNVFSGNGPRR